jgi:hypothetical protein
VDSLLSFLKHSSTLDLLVVILIILLTVTLILVAVITLFATRGRKLIYVVLIAAALPLLLGLVGTFLRYDQIERSLSQISEGGPEIVAAARAEAWFPTYFGLTGTALVELTGVSGLMLKKTAGRDSD